MFIIFLGFLILIVILTISKNYYNYVYLYQMDYLDNSVKEGDRIVLSPNVGYGFVPSEEQPYLRGGFGEYIYLWHPKTIFLMLSKFMNNTLCPFMASHN